MGIVGSTLSGASITAHGQAVQLQALGQLLYVGFIGAFTGMIAGLIGGLTVGVLMGKRSPPIKEDEARDKEWAIFLKEKSRQ
jgi:hypothetical protein